MTAWKARRRRNGNVMHNGDGRHNGNGQGVGGKEWGKLGQYHRERGVAINLTLFLCAYYIVLLAPDCPKPSDQPRDAARREECSDLDEKSLTTF